MMIGTYGEARSLVAAALDLPSHSWHIARSKDLILDNIGCMVAGASTQDFVHLAHVIAPDSNSIRDRVLLLSVAAHVLDFDDTHAPSLCHISSVLVPSLLGTAADIAEQDLNRITAAYLFGTNLLGILAPIGKHLNRSLAHSSSVLGCLCAAAACGWLRTGRADPAAAAMDVAAYLVQAVAGLNYSAGTAVKPLHVGRASESAYLAGRLAASQRSTPTGALIGAGGLFERLGCSQVALPEPDENAVDGTGLKPYPCCLLSHSTIDLVLLFRAETQTHDPAQLERVSIQAHPLTVNVSNRTAIVDPVQGKFSLGYCVHAAITNGCVDLAAFTEEYRRTLPAGWFDKLQVTADPSMSETGAAVEIARKSGTWSGSAEAAFGSPARPMMRADITAKARANFRFAGEIAMGKAVEHALDAQDAGEIWSLLSRIVHLDRLTENGARAGNARH